MTNSSNYKLHMPVVKQSSRTKATSATPHKLMMTTDKYYQNKAENEWAQEYYIIYNSYTLEEK